MTPSGWRGGDDSSTTAMGQRLTRPRRQRHPQGKLGNNAARKLARNGDNNDATDNAADNGGDATTAGGSDDATGFTIVYSCVTVLVVFYCSLVPCYSTTVITHGVDTMVLSHTPRV
ncbi:hypothetical protein EDB84DRAFT_1438804 [Lactarius hengduanensis]|nr:hypothetical protein EDB84DRAFT_1438804 [Lactarius hengduanensis]